MLNFIPKTLLIITHVPQDSLTEILELSPVLLGRLPEKSQSMGHRGPTESAVGRNRGDPLIPEERVPSREM